MASTTSADKAPAPASRLHFLSARRRPAAVRTALRESPGGLLVLALITGAGTGCGAVAFRWLITAFTRVFSGHTDYAAAGHAANARLPWLGHWFVLLTPVAAGLLYGPLVHRFAREARGHGVPEVMYAVARRGGRIAPQVAVVKALASALTIGGGGSVGREGPIVQIGSALGSSLGSLVRVAQDRLKVLVACGAAGGIAATFNAPLAGVFFAMELVLRDFTAESFGMVVLSAVTASVIGRAVLGDSPFLRLPPFHVDHLPQYLLFALLGLLTGATGALFTKVLYRVEDLCDGLWRGPEWLRPAAGGLLLGGLLLVLPQMYGVGYPVLDRAVSGRYAAAFLLVLLVGKMVATSLTIGIGGSGGVFAPSLFIGAMAGSAYGQVVHHLAPGLAGPPGAYGLIGMGAVFSGAARAPITAVIILFELTGEYTVILPLMTAVVLATLISRLLSRDTVYTAKLRRRGVDLDQSVSPLTVRQAMGAVPDTLPTAAPLSEADELLARVPHGALPVVAPDGSYRGTVSARSVAEALTGGTDPATRVGDVAHLPRALAPGDGLDAALDALAASEGQGVPVLEPSGRYLLGWVTHQDLLTALHGSWAAHTRPDQPPHPAPVRP